MDFSEVVVFLASGFAAVMFFIRWYWFTLSGVKIRRNDFSRTVLCLLPMIVFIIIIYTLTALASFDVVDSGFWIFFYVLIGFSWLYFSMFLMFTFFDLSWVDDALNNNNPAAALAVAGGGLGVTLIYAGANIGDGPGWWCVFFAGGLGIISWVILSALANSITNVFRRITVDRDIFCGVRTGSYLLSSGIILGRASAGDWTSFSKTVAEFSDGWPVLILTAVFILTELIFTTTEKQEEQSPKSVKWFLSLILGIAYIVTAVYALKILPPLPVGPIYYQ